MAKKLILLLALLCLIGNLFPQDAPKLTYQSQMLGWGFSRVYDTYLSPLDYSGNNIVFLSEQLKMTNIANGNIVSLSSYSIDYSWTKNPSETASFYSGLLEYDYGFLFKFPLTDNFRIFAGPQADVLLGFIYNNRNGNNPATGKFHLDLRVSAMASYTFKIKSRTVLLRYCFAMPVVGMMYSPDFGQSYYEISLGDNSQLAYYSSFVNHFSIKQSLTVETPLLSTLSLKTGIVHSHYETRINSLNTRISALSFCLGMTKNFYIVPNNKLNGYRNVFE